MSGRKHGKSPIGAGLDVERGSGETKEQVAALRVGLQEVQYRLREATFPVIVLLAGNDRPGVADTIHTLNTWMDPRSLRTNALGLPTLEERERPVLWRYWRDLPERGQVGVFMGGWTTLAIIGQLRRKTGRTPFRRQLERIRHFERMLVDDGALLIKFWLHLEKDALRELLKGSVKSGSEPWRLHESDRWLYRHYKRARKVIEKAIDATDHEAARWRVVDSAEPERRNVAVAGTILEMVRRRLEAPSRKRRVSSRIQRRGKRLQESALARVDLTRSLERDKYDRLLDRYRAELHDLVHQALEKGIATVMVFEGWDAAGKGGVIRRLTAALDPPTFRVYPIAAPTEEELAHHYLWRFWRRLPRRGHVAIFDRSWYGRVLVERVERLVGEEAWRRAYDEINEFEAQLIEHGMLLMKFWLHIDKDTQLERFNERKKTPFKSYKITAEDYRNRKKWDDYALAVDEMVARTSTRAAPWTLVPSRDKRWARVEVIRTVCRRLQRAL